MPLDNTAKPCKPFEALRPRMHAVLLALACLFLGAGPALAADPVLLTGIEFLAEDGAGLLRINLNAKPRSLRSFALDGPDRIVLDISPATLPGGKRILPAAPPLVRGVRAAQFDQSTVRVVLDLTAPAPHTVSSSPAGNGAHLLLVTLGRTDARTPSPPIAAAAPIAPATRAEAGPRPPDMQGSDSGNALAGPVPAGQRETSAPPSPAKGQTGETKKILLFGAAGASAGPAAAPVTADNATGMRNETRNAFDLSGFLRARAAQQLHESAWPEQARMERGTLHLEGKWTPDAADGAAGETASTYVLGSLRTEYLGFGPEPASDDRDLELWEGYVFHSGPGWDLRLGRQIVRWGKADQVSPVDNVNPQDMREFLLPDLEERKIPNWMARLRLLPESGRDLRDTSLEAILVPVFEENEFDYTGNTWALLGTAPGDVRISEDKPRKGLDNADWGLRAATTLAGWDLAASYLRATEKSPRLRFEPMNPAGPTIHADYGRQNIFGLEFETTLGKFGFRGEGAYFDAQSFPTENIDTTSKPVLHYIFGMDYLGEEDWYVNVQLSHQHVFEYDDAILYLRRDNFYLSGEANREFWRGNAKLKFRYAVDLRDGASLLTPEAILTSFKDLEIALGSDLFFGPENSYFGRYRDRNQVFLQFTYFF